MLAEKIHTRAHILIYFWTRLCMGVWTCLKQKSELYEVA
jgi:hypothetical protein